MKHDFEVTDSSKAAIVSESLSAQQRRFWVLEQLEHAADSHRVSMCMRVRGKLDAARLEEAIQVTQDRHDVFRSSFVMQNDAPRAVSSLSTRGSLAIVDLTSLPLSEREKSAHAVITKELQKPFDLQTGPLLRAVLCRLASDEHLCMLTLHRIICDSVSALLLSREIVVGYTSLVTETPFPPPGAQYADYLRIQESYLRSEAYAVDLEYWKQKLNDAPNALELPTDHNRGMSRSLRGSAQRMLITGDLLSELKTFSNNEGTSVFLILLASFCCLLARYTSAEDIMIGTEVQGRNDRSMAAVVGALSNHLVLRAHYSAEASFREMLRRISKEWTEIAEHQSLPFGTLLDALNVPRDITRSPLFQISFNRGVTWEPVDAAGLHWQPVQSATGTEVLDLSVEIVERDHETEALFFYSADLFEDATIRRSIEHFRALLQSAIENPAQAVSSLPILTADERHELAVKANESVAEYRVDRCVHELVEEQGERTPDAVAVVYENVSLTYRELNQRANRLAQYLIEQGVGPETLVAMCMERSLDMIVCILGILKAGGAYLPLDLSYPVDRLAFMIEDANPPVVITQESLVSKLPNHKAQVICLDRDWPVIAQKSSDNPRGVASPDNLAYIIYTSGSTGKPKGCQITHFNVVRLFQATWDWYKFDENDIWTMFHSYAFDFSVWEIWGALFYGGRVVVVPYLVSRSPESFYRLLHDERVTVLNQTPSAFRQLMVAEESVGVLDLALRYVVFGGEALEMQSLKPWYQRHGDQKPQLVNMYGITETTVHVTYRPLSASDTERGSVIGRSIPDLQLYILDQHREPVPIGVTGEMYVGGAGVARGYLNRPELTSERFIPDPFSTRGGARLYKTGDLARILADGDIEYLGRIDHQVKIRGFRIELGEIESVLASHPAVHHSLVLAREDTPGDRRLVAYIVPKSKEPPSIAELRTHVRQTLPEYMVPSAFSIQAKLPLTPSGKIDRRALPPPAPEQRDRSAIMVPRNQTEELLLSIFRDILNVESVSVTDDFFDLGGHSLTAARLVSRIHVTTGRQIQLATLFRAATVESLARLINQESELVRDPVVIEIQRGNSNHLPFFAIVPPGEESLGYAILGRHMGPEQPVYKIQGHAPVTLSERPYTADEMSAMTSEYIAAMRTVQPHGPYCLGGLCDGAHIAEQIVLSLESQAEEVGLFAVFDTWVLQHSQRRWFWKIHYYGERLRQMGKLSLAERLASYRRVGRNKVRELVGAKPARTDWRQTYWPEGFTPKRFRAPVFLIKRPKQPFYYIGDPHMGWGNRTMSEVEIREVDFSHLEILREPHVQFFGEVLSERMARVAGTASSTRQASGELR